MQNHPRLVSPTHAEAHQSFASRAYWLNWWLSNVRVLSCYPYQYASSSRSTIHCLCVFDAFQRHAFFLVLGRARRCHHAGIHNGSTAYLNSLESQVMIYRQKQLRCEFMLFETMMKFADRCLIGCRFAAKIYSSKLAHGIRIAQRFFYGGI